MIQLLPRVNGLVYFTGSDYPALGAPNSIGSALDRTPLPWAATARNLVLTSHDPLRTQAATQTLLKNNVATALAVTLPAASSGPVLNDSDEVALAQFDDVMCRFQASPGAESGGIVFGYCYELESQGNIFGIPGNSTGSCPAGIGAAGGALGNGFWSSYDTAGPQVLSTSYSICSVPGSLTHLAMRTYATPPAVGSSWVGYYRVLRYADQLLGVTTPTLQDGTGGTVDTRCEIVGDGSTDRAVATFDLHLDVGDIAEVLYYRAGLDHPFEVAGQIGVGVGFVPDDDGWFMLTGGSNVDLASYLWLMGTENNEPVTGAPVGPGGFTARGLYVRGTSPGILDEVAVTNTLRRNSADTAITVTRTGTGSMAQIEDLLVPFVEGDVASFSNISINGGNSSRLYWGLAASYGADEELVTREVIGPHLFINFNRTQPGS
jgi:hypothetical protein